ncbi:MAG: helix-turn-helix transcriptional regulator [Nitrospira sp.]|nr:helix-turn-helix transcriptional regulator [Nitrospira sp.]
MLKALRLHKKLTQAQLAKTSRISQAYVANLERGVNRNPSLAVLTRLAKALGVTSDEVIKALSAQGRRRATR